MLVHLHNIWNSELTMRIIFCSPTKMCTHVQLKHKINNCAVGYKTNICKFTYDLKTLYRFIYCFRFFVCLSATIFWSNTKDYHYWCLNSNKIERCKSRTHCISQVYPWNVMHRDWKLTTLTINAQMFQTTTPEFSKFLLKYNNNARG